MTAVRTIFVVGTAIFILAFFGLSYDSIRQLPARTNEAALTSQVVAGKVAWQTHDCTDCHTLMGNGAYYAPDLTKVMVTRGEPFVHAWLTAPAGQMPNQRLTAQEVNDLVAFFHWVGGIDTNGWPPAPVFPVAASTSSLASTGQALFQQRACAGCHGAAGEGTPAAPKLAGALAQRTDDYLLRWLKDPLAVNPAAKMPNLGLQDADVKALVAFVRTLN